MNRIIISLLLLLTSGIAQGRTTYRHYSVTDGLLNNQVRQLIELPNGQILACTEGEYSLFNGHGFTALTCLLDSLHPLPRFGGHGYLWQGDSILWLKNYYSLLMFDIRQRRFRYDYGNNLEKEHVKQFIYENGDSLTHERMERMDMHRALLDSLTRGTALEGEQLQAYCNDRQGGQWLGMLNGGIIYLPPINERISHIIPCNDIIRRMANIDGKMMLIAGSKGIYIFDTHSKKVVKTLITGDINCADMSKDKSGNLWMSTKQGIYRYYDNTLTNYNTTNTTGFLHNHMRFAHPLDDGRLLVCNLMHNLGYLWPEHNRVDMLNSRIQSLDKYRTMIAAADAEKPNEQVVCTQNGLFLLDTEKNSIRAWELVDSIQQYSHKYNCVLADSHRRFWLGTQNGLIVVCGSHARRITHDDGLTNNCIQSLAEDPDGNIWVGTSRGICRIDGRADGIEQLRILPIAGNALIMQTEMMERGLCIMPDGTAFFATHLGLIAFSTREFNKKPTPLSVAIAALKVAGRDMPLDTMPLQLAYNQNNINLHFSAFNYAQPELTRYRYRIVSHNEQWNYLPDEGEMATVYFNELSPGTYTIEIQASMGDNEWGPALRKSFIINPPLWLSWWAKMLYAVLAMLCAYLILSMYLKKHRQRMERDNDERVNQLFELRDEARHQFALSLDISPEKISVSKTEEHLVEQMMKAIGENMANGDYTVDNLARDVGMSRASLYKKVQAMLGITPNDFMRSVRLKHAAHLLAESELTVTQIALNVGFQTPRYFAQCFKKTFGVTPAEYREGN